MKLKELTGYHNTPIQGVVQKAQHEFGNGKKTRYDSAFNNFYEYIKQHGFTRVGTGSNADVYEKDGYLWLFKVFSGDPAYLSYYKYCKVNQHNPHVPRVKGGLRKLSGNTYCVQIEKLRPFPSTGMKFIQTLQTAATGLVDTNPIDDEMKDEYRRSINQIGSKFPKLIELLEDLTAFRNYTFDLDESNIMMRGVMPVITDPFS
jgi:hypothetical protein